MPKLRRMMRWKLCGAPTSLPKIVASTVRFLADVKQCRSGLSALICLHDFHFVPDATPPFLTSRPVAVVLLEHRSSLLSLVRAAVLLQGGGRAQKRPAPAHARRPDLVRPLHQAW